MASRLRPRKSWDIATAVLVALLIALYSVFAVLTFWGALGGIAGAFGVWLCTWIIRQRPGIPVLVLAGIALLLNVAAFIAATAILFACCSGRSRPTRPRALLRPRRRRPRSSRASA